MTQKEFIALMYKVIDEIKNDPIEAAKADAEVESLMLENPELSEILDNKLKRPITWNELVEMIYLVKDYLDQKKIAN